MATAKSRNASRKSIGQKSPGRMGLVGFAMVAILAGGAVTYFYGAQISGYSAAGTSYGAKNACSCRYVAGRELSSCKDDFLPGMEVVFLSDDEDERAVSAYVPLISSNTARFREGFGCVLDPWDQ